jgi:hypothetical protein
VADYDATVFVLRVASNEDWRRGDSKPSPKKHNRQYNHTLTASQEKHLSDYLSDLLQKFPEITQIVKAWPGLSKADRQRILKIIDQQEGKKHGFD